jgi:hypothetical protein
MFSSSSSKKVSPSMSITNSFPYHQEKKFPDVFRQGKIQDVYPEAKLKLSNEILKSLIRESQAFEEKVENSFEEETHREEAPAAKEDGALESKKCTMKKLRRMKRRLFIEAANAPHVPATCRNECSGAKTRGRE